MISRVMTSEDSIKELAERIERLTSRDGEFTTAIAPLHLYRYSGTLGLFPTLYVPALCIIAQGSKQVLLGDDLYTYDPAQYLLVSVDLPVASRMLDATPKKPHLALRLDLDPALVAALAIEAGIPELTEKQTSIRGLAVNRLDVPLMEAVLRLFRLLETPHDIRVLGPLAIREVVYRLLMGEQGERLRLITANNSQTQRIAQAIHWIKSNYNQSFRIEDIAREVYMSPSGLHHHFKAVTAMSPLQYQKQLRLQEARRLMLGESIDAATAGYRVGYESPSQFSREYSRLFGAPPLRDIAQLRNTFPSGMDATQSAQSMASTP